MIYFAKDTRFEISLDGTNQAPAPNGYVGIYVSHRISFLSVYDAGQAINNFAYQNNLYGSQIMFDFQSEGYQQQIIHFMNDVVKELVSNYKGFTVDMFHYYSGVLDIEENINYYKSLPFEHLPNNVWVSPIPIQPYIIKPLFKEQNVINRKVKINTKLKKFISMNGNPRTHRRIAYKWLYKNDLIKESFYSFDASKIIGDSYQNNPLLKKYDSIVDNWVESRTMTLSKEHGDTLTDDRIKKEDIYYFDNSYFSLVQETFYDNLLDYSSGDIPFYECILISEKTYRPIYFKHPFVMLGVKGTLAALKKSGFKTFSPHFNESYDDIDDPVLRLQMALNEVHRLCNLSNDEWLTIQRELLPIVEYNYKILTTYDDMRLLKGKRK